MKVIDFYADWCGPCQMLKPIMEELETEYGEGVKFERVNIDEEPVRAQEFEVMSIPTLVFMDDEGKVLETMVGLREKEEIKAVLDKFAGEGK